MRQKELLSGRSRGDLRRFSKLSTNPTTVPQLAFLYFDHNLSLNDISEQTGLAVPTISYRLKGAGYTLRSRGAQRGRMKHPEVTNDQVVQALKGGLNQTDTGKRFGISRAAVVYRSRQAGYDPVKRKHKLDLPEAEIIDRYKVGESLEGIAGSLGIGVNTVRRFLESRAIPIRSKSHRSAAVWAERNQKLAFARQFPADWFKKPIDWRVIGTELLSRDYMDNQELGEWLDDSRVIKCPYGSSWSRALVGAHKNRSAINFITDIRNWVNRPAKPAKDIRV